MTTVYEQHGVVRVNVRVAPRASSNHVCGEANGQIKIRLAAPPVDGKANAALIRFLADTLSLPQSAICIEHGLNGRNKRVSISGASAAFVRRALGLAAPTEKNPGIPG